MRRNLFLIIIIWFFCFSLNGQKLISSDTLIVSEIRIEGNFVTSKKIIFRELTFKVNEFVGREEIEFLKQTSINNLNKTALFNFIGIKITEPQKGMLYVLVDLTERWFIWPNAYLNHTEGNFSEWWRTKDLNKLEYGFGLKVNNLRGMKETLELNYRFGNFTKYELAYNGFHLDMSERHLMSLRASYKAQNIIPWIIENNKYSNIKTGYKSLMSTNFALKYTYRKEYFNSHSLGFGYSGYCIADTILYLNPYFFGFMNGQQRYFNLEYEFIRDTRDSHFYPKTGYKIVAIIKKKGLGIFPDEYKSTDIICQIFGYRKIVNRFYAASGILFSSISNNDQVFFEQTGLGYLQFVRGYEYYTVSGDRSFLFKNLLKFELVKMKVINLNKWPFREAYQINKIPFEVYTNLFFDAGYVNDKTGTFKLYNNTLVNRLMYSSGLGIDFVTYYDKCLRFDYSFNALGEHGLFIHWKAAIR